MRPVRPPSHPRCRSRRSPTRKSSPRSLPRVPGWRTWAGPTSVRTAEGTQQTPDEDGYILVLETPSSPALDLAAGISCEWRSGDVW